MIKISRLFSSKGQIALPAVLVIPSLLLFIYLLFETAKISREKIRHQFALDSAVFIEMSNYSDYLNRTAYVNGPFPHRIFKEAFDCPPDLNLINRTDDEDDECLYDILYEMGAYPKMTDDTDPDSMSKWDFEFRPRKDGDSETDLNMDDPVFPEVLELMQHKRVLRLWLSVKTLGYIYRIYYQVYNLLGEVQESQKTIYDDISGDASFLRKSYYLNAGSCMAGTCAQDAASAILSNKLTTDIKRINRIEYWGKGDIQSAYVAPPVLGKKADMPSPGLFQLTVIKGNMSQLYQGITTMQSYELTENYFDVNLNEFNPKVRSTIAVRCAAGAGVNCIWPNPTPKFQTRLLP